MADIRNYFSAVYIQEQNSPESNQTTYHSAIPC